MCGDTEQNWLNFEEPMWTLTPANSSNRVMNIGTNGYISSYYVNSDYYLFPVVYLKSSVKITGGTGTSGDPYIFG